MPALEALVKRFELEAHTKTVGVSVDSRHSHANWAWDLGGISYPLLADFQPRGAIAEKYGVYLAADGITDRATVIVDSTGMVRHVSSVGPGGQRDIGQLLELARSIDREYPIVNPSGPRVPRNLAKDATIYVREGCRFCRAVMRAMTNLHCEQSIRVRDVNNDPAARADLDAVAGANARVPALVENGKVMFESAEIIKHIADVCRV